MMMKRTILISLLIFTAIIAKAQKNTPKSYIDSFKTSAIKIMHETGVPASIVLGIAMHESGCGNSALANNLNNQFGVKGDKKIFYYKHKRKVVTAYKRYNSVLESFEDFARIMTERKEFNGLIEKLTHFDYYGWAHNIQKNGYASDKKWSKSVLRIIEKYQLNILDEKPEKQPELAQNN